MYEIVLPNQPGYESLRHVYTATGSPAEILRPAADADVGDALRYARDTGLPLAIRSGGHGISSRATNDGGIVIDLGRLDEVERLDDRRVRVGAGARWGQVARRLHPWSLAISSGDSGDVGVGGLATAGGIGLLGRRFGLTIDHMTAAQVVTADGELRRASETENADLFWAVRGAGANVGIATSLEFRAAPLDLVAHASFAYAPSDLAEFLEAWGALLESAPREVSGFLYVFGGARPFAQATVVHASADERGANRSLETFTALPSLVSHRAVLAPYMSVVPVSGARHTGQQQVATRNGLFEHLDSPTSSLIAHGLQSGPFGMIQVRSLGGAINDVAPEATAFGHRHQNFHVTAVAGPSAVDLDAGWEPLAHLADGMYLSFQSEHSDSDLASAFPPPILERLRAVKSHWDPDRVFGQNFDVSVLSPSAA
ncbi:MULTISPECIES: FAD-binding oxidoreductase [Nocardioides]|uniref:FAD-binding oxidoreductase n=1 Tax=Nocardioides vastitatis TaxID=2568655 RepID=A0ABW0ZCS2_9ACTN|nr:FAD-binding oxidoreductase [Nocardioides sp.]THJ08651.1 FAD-binding oxidoreductase [Nocardioides sp.]